LWLADTYRWLADELLSRQRAAEAETHFRTSLEIIMSLTAQPLVESPNAAPLRYSVNLCFRNFIQYLAAARRVQELQQAYEQAIAFYAKLSVERPGEAYFREELAKFQAELEKLKAKP
jgi:hypothetical protein